MTQQLPPMLTQKTINLNDESVRFQVELEFVQCLANPNYLNFIAQRGYFKETTFINYLKYLLYWKEATYVKYLRYPQCLHTLELLQHAEFRNELVNAPCAKFIEDQMLLHWQFYTRKRVRVQQSMMETARQQNTQDNARSVVGKT
uniref:Mediator of RNA polymerase II transcription subunit 31 n=1 Tax=Ciona savignyi TaxID=51511 RepID=H2Y9N8_CIOSA